MPEPSKMIFNAHSVLDYRIASRAPLLQKTMTTDNSPSVVGPSTINSQSLELHETIPSNSKKLIDNALKIYVSNTYRKIIYNDPNCCCRTDKNVIIEQIFPVTSKDNDLNDMECLGTICAFRDNISSEPSNLSNTSFYLEDSQDPNLTFYRAQIPQGLKALSVNENTNQNTVGSFSNTDECLNTKPRSYSNRTSKSTNNDSIRPQTLQSMKSSLLPVMRLRFLIILLLTIFPSCNSKYVEGYLRTKQNWAFLTRFCFLSEEGKFQFDISYGVQRNSHQKLLLYYDEPHQWEAVYHTDTTCHEKESVMKREHNQFVNLTLFSETSECEIMKRRQDSNSTYRCAGYRSFKSRRERWWFIAVSNCDSKDGLTLHYRLTLTNGFSYWYKHFSADEFYILRTNLVALILELGVFFLSILAAAELRRKHHLHTTYRLYMYSVVLQVLGLLLLNIHYARYGVTGVGIPACKLAGQVMFSVSTIITVLFVLLMGKGFNITRGRLKQGTTIRLTSFMVFFIVTYMALFVYEQTMFDPGEVLYIYESYPGYGLVLLRLCGCVMFFYSCFFTVKHYPEKARFYTPFFVFYTLWFISGPIIILVCNLVIDKWVREKVVNGVERGVELFGHLFFLFITRPNMANTNFPYHVKTTQIEAMEGSEVGKIGNNSLDHFGTHLYAPEYAVAEPKNFTTAPDLFMVTGTLEMSAIPGPATYITPPPSSIVDTPDHKSEIANDMSRSMRHRARRNNSEPSSELRPLPVLPPLPTGQESLRPLRSSNANNVSSTVYTVHDRRADEAAAAANPQPSAPPLSADNRIHELE